MKLSDGVNAVCAALAVFAMAYALYHVFPLFLYAALTIAAMYGYAWLNRKVRK